MRTTELDKHAFSSVLPNGLTVLTERVSHVRSAAVGIWVRSASAHEVPVQMGVSHLLEHMVFKGTERRSAQEIALALEARGGSLDAYTSRDATTYQARVLDAELPRAVDVLTDLVRRPTLKNVDLDLERNVILEEINTVEDTPDDQVFDLSAQALWPEHPYGYRILGTKDTVTALTTGDLRGLHGRAYVPRNCVVAAAGNLEHQALLDLLGEHGWFDDGPHGDPPGSPPVPPATRGVTAKFTKDTAQTHIVFATDTVPFQDERKYAIMLLANVFGGGMSSRLFQRIREELGLAYAIYAYTTLYHRAGSVGVYVGTQPKTAQAAADAIVEEYAKLAREGLTGAALDEAKQQTQGQLMLSLESPLSRMYRLAAGAVYGDPYQTLDQVLARVASLTAEQVGAVAAEFFAPERQTTVWLGPS
jgi:predicted Zn-dependent peptidase